MSRDLHDIEQLGTALSKIQKEIIAARWEVGVRVSVTAPTFDRTDNPAFDYAIGSFNQPRSQLFTAHVQSVAPPVLLDECNREDLPKPLATRKRGCLSGAANGKSH